MNSFRTRRAEGFSLVELLVTVVIIAVLAAIAIPLYSNQKNKAALSAAQQDARAIGSAINGMLLEYAHLGTSNGTIGYSAPNVTFTLTAPSPTTAPASISVRLSPNSTFSVGSTLANTRQWCIKITNSSGSTTQSAVVTEAGLQAGMTTCSNGAASA